MHVGLSALGVKRIVIIFYILHLKMLTQQSMLMILYIPKGETADPGHSNWICPIVTDVIQQERKLWMNLTISLVQQEPGRLG